LQRVLLLAFPWNGRLPRYGRLLSRRQRARTVATTGVVACEHRAVNVAETSLAVLEEKRG
jgi:hypothetical protein